MLMYTCIYIYAQAIANERLNYLQQTMIVKDCRACNANGATT